jgi:hypothetical protein
MINVYTSVMKTNDYSLFKIMDGNRRTNSANLNQIIESMKEKQLVIPITVNEKFEIIDGQHRFKACEYLGLPVYYIMQQGYDINDVIRANVNGGRKWFDADYLHRYCDLKDEKYLKVSEIINDFDVTINDFLKILSIVQQKNIPQLKREFRTGNIELDGIDTVISFFMCLESFHEFRNYKQSHFITAFSRLFFKEGYDHSQMERKLKQYLPNIVRQRSVDDYLSILCNKVYSYGTTKNPVFYSSETKKFHS